ncbi:M3 family oligoendopeptidase [Gorillibacterium massiliense]|uniref:M3 family oligoendopeptidase n=1 Tax=Gorillibacterium massiliense TaxID=1280390 RepID=UPI0004B2B6AD|nr:M3 family oligoendopeptidase [Gorillibacterium massiliense]
MSKSLDLTWDLDSIFAGGSESPAFSAFLDSTRQRINALQAKLTEMKSPQNVAEAEADSWMLTELQEIGRMLLEAGAFTECLVAQSQSDRKAVQLYAQVKDNAAKYQAIMTQLDRYLSGIPEAVFAAILEKEPWHSISFSLTERREAAKEKMAPELEALAADLAVDGYHSWGEAYNTAVSRIRIPSTDASGEESLLSAGQAFNKLHTPDREERKIMFNKWEEAWQENSDLCADALNYLAGFRLRLYRARGWSSVHKEPLAINRMTEKTLNTMWDVIDRNKDFLLAYFKRKAKLLGVDKLAWHDVTAPVGDSETKISYEEGAEFIVNHFRTFSPKMADFAALAIENRWVEAEDRPGKRPGGFCTSFPIKNETRIFMTYSGTSDNVSTLAHELGHGYHQHVMDGLPAFAQDYAMNVAETASTFAETIVSDAAINSAGSKEEKIALLEVKIQNAVAFFMNIHARFIFETAFYAERENGLVSVERLNELMVDAQKKAYRDSLSEYHPHFWAAKLHFYSTDVPFYNFPYTFGFLFSSGIYASAQREGSAFEDKYIALLRDTAVMTVEDLAKKHLGVNLEEPDFWQQAVDISIRDVELFLELTEEE